MADNQVIREPEIKPQHEVVWTHKTEQVGYKIEHVAYRNGVEALRKDEAEIDQTSSFEGCPYDYKQ